MSVFVIGKHAFLFLQSKKRKLAATYGLRTINYGLKKLPLHDANTISFFRLDAVP